MSPAGGGELKFAASREADAGASRVGYIARM
jgi:hypothetical protein